MVQTLQSSALPGNDLVLNASNSLTTLSGIDAVAAACNTAALTQLGECVLQTGQGLPNFSVLWSGIPDYGLWESYLGATLLNVPGVTAVEGITITQKNNVVNYVAAIQTQYGPTTVQGAING